MMKILVGAFAALLLLAPVLPSVAEETVSDEVDQVLWCGAAFVAVSLTEGMAEDEIAAAEVAAEAIFATAHTAMVEDGIEEGEYDRLVTYYTEMAVENLTNPDAEMRYTSDECAALVTE